MPSSSVLASELLAWYDRNARRLPWRIGPVDVKAGVRPDPYRIWLSEIMLQQTTVRAVEGYFKAFTAAWPRVNDLARAQESDILTAWAGLGYYARARNLHRCARVLVDRHGGRFPDSAARLRELPGIGEYTAAAIAAIAFGEPVAVVDGNVERVAARLFAIETPKPGLKKLAAQALAEHVPGVRSGDFAQAMMDLGATICTPKRPACGLCPWAQPCRSRTGDPERLPVKPAKRVRPIRRGAGFVLFDEHSRLLLRRRPDKGLLAGMSEIPVSPWSEAFATTTWREYAPARARWRRAAGPVGHTFTHFHLEADVYWAMAPAGYRPSEGTWWAPIDRLDEEALPTVMRKMIAHGVEAAGLGGRGGRVSVEAVKSRR